MRSTISLAAAMLLLCTKASAQQTTTVELILDASGSMGNKLSDGRYRISAAKEVLQGLVSALPETEGLHVGLRVYGSRLKHTEEGACDDTELFVPMQGVDHEALVGVVRNARALGATPIARSLELAAADFPAEGRKLIVLVTDGEESCGGDVKAAAEKLKAAGVDIGFKIVGIGLEKEAVERFRQIGEIVNANDAKALAHALQEAMASAVKPQTQGLQVRVQVTLNGQPVPGAKVAFLDAIEGTATPLPAGSEPGLYQASLAPGAYRARIESDRVRPSPREFAGLNVLPGGDSLFVFELAPPAQVRLTVAPAAPAAGSAVTVQYEGAPGEGGQGLFLAPVGEPEGNELPNWEEVPGATGSMQLVTPDEPAELEARFFVIRGDAGRVLAGRSAPFKTLPVTATLKVPAQVDAGSTIPVEWTGPDHPDYIVVAPQGTAEGWIDYGNSASTAVGSPLTLAAPATAGRYEVRYITGQSLRTLARATVVLLDVAASLGAPAAVPAGSDFEVRWQGPRGETDSITIVEAGADEATINYGNSKVTHEAASPMQWLAPTRPGRYELRFLSQSAGGIRVWTRTAFEVTDVTASLEAPHSARPEQQIEVRWTGPGASEDHITLVEAGAPEDAVNWGRLWKLADSTNPLKLALIEPPGRYELRYVLMSWDSPRAVASAPLTVE